MKVIQARNVADAWAQAALMFASPQTSGIQSSASRNSAELGDVLVCDAPVTTVYERPLERVLLDPVRDCNPFLHAFEALWMLAGRDDAAFLDNFVSDFSARYAEADGRQHGAYGYRWRRQFTTEGRELDQLDEVVRLLRANPLDRQAVIQMWDASADLGVPGLRDRPCNTQIYLRLRLQQFIHDEFHPVLDITVTCRSNDVVWGAYGANAVHFSVLQEYLAARIGCGVGRLYQVSNNWHRYASGAGRMDVGSAVRNLERTYPGSLPLVTAPEAFDHDVRAFVECPVTEPYNGFRFRNARFVDTFTPMWLANAARRAGDWEGALAHARRVAAPDWRAACVEWLERRMTARAAR